MEPQNIKCDVTGAAPGVEANVHQTHDITVIMMAERRLRHLGAYLEEGLWDHIPLLLVSAGPVSQTVTETTSSFGVNVVESEKVQGRAGAWLQGVRVSGTERFMFSAEGDFCIGLTACNEDARGRWTGSDAVLFAALPQVHVINDQCETQRVHDRRAYAGMTGRELLWALLQSLEALGLAQGAIFDRKSTEGLLAEPFFEDSLDLVLMARLCGRYPDRAVFIGGHGRYMRLEREHPGDRKEAFTVEKAVMHLTAVGIVGFYLMELGVLDEDELAVWLAKRGSWLQRTFGIGQQAATTLRGLITGRLEEALTEEARETLLFLQSRQDRLPAELLDLLGARGLEVLQRQVEAAPLPVLAHPAHILPLHPRVAPQRLNLFVGGGQGAGTALMQTLLCQADHTTPALPPSPYLRTLVGAFGAAPKGRSAAAPPDSYFEDIDHFTRYHTGVVHRFLDDTCARFEGAKHLILTDPELTPYFTYLSKMEGEVLFICMVRDPRDVVAAQLSGRPTLATSSDHLREAIRTRDVIQLSQYYRRYYTPLLATRDEALRKKVLFVRYEDLADNTENVVRQLQRFTQLNLTPWQTEEEAEAFSTPLHPTYPVQGLHRLPAAPSISRNTPARTLSLQEIQTIEAECIDLFEVFQYSYHVLSATG